MKTFKISMAYLISFGVILSSCHTTSYYTESQKILGTDKVFDSYYKCNVVSVPSHNQKKLAVEFSKNEIYGFDESRETIKKEDFSETRMGGLATMLSGALAGAIIAVGGENEDGSYSEPNPGAGKAILIGGLILGGLMVIIPNSKKTESIDTVTVKKERFERLADNTYQVWTNVNPDQIINKRSETSTIELDVIEDLGLDYFKGHDSVSVYFRPHGAPELTYDVKIGANEFLSKYIDTSSISDSIPVYQAPTLKSPVIGYLSPNEVTEYIMDKNDFYIIRWKSQMAYLPSQQVGYYYALK